MEEALQLGLEAYKDNWGADWVEIKFEEFYDDKIKTIIEERKKNRRWDWYHRAQG